MKNILKRVEETTEAKEVRIFRYWKVPNNQLTNIIRNKDNEGWKKLD
jgi:hypothetical protein